MNQVVSKRFCKRQQMQWSKRGAHLLLQARVKTLNREWAVVFKQWYPDMQVTVTGSAAQAGFQSASMQLASNHGTTWSDPAFHTWEGDSGTLHTFNWSA